MKSITLSALDHTWIIDLDGTILKHNGYKLDGFDTLLDGAAEFLRGIPAGDMVVLITSRKDEYREATEIFLADNEICFDHIIYNAPYGERILLNDRKQGGLDTAVAVNVGRDEPFKVAVVIDEAL